MNDPFNTGLPGYSVASSWQTAFALFFLFSFCWAFWKEIRTLLHGRLPTLHELRRNLGLRLATVFALTMVCMSGGTKGPGGYASNRIAQFITALRSGQVVDDSGVVAQFAESEAVRYFNMESQGIIDAASNSAAASIAQINALGSNLVANPFTCAYIAADLPRAEPGVITNHNVDATLERATMTGSVIRAWIWYSQTPFQSPNVSVDASVSVSNWVTLVSVTNSWPNMTTVNGVPCVEYDFLVPDGMKGVPLRPNYELAWGGFNPAQYLTVPSGGLLVSTNNVSCLPYTGWDTNWPSPWGTNLQVQYVGGVAVKAIYKGTNYTGVVL